MMSGVANYGMTGDAFYPPGHIELAKYEMKPEVVCGAVDKEQAKIVWDDAKDMALGSPDILKRLRVQKTKISHKTRGGELKRLSKDTKNKDGGAPCIIIIDEYHAHPTDLIKRVTSSGKGKRSQCLEFIITTAGEDVENKPCKIEDDTVKKILSGELPSETYFGVIREIDDEDDPHDEKCWVKANPIFRNRNEYSQELYNTVKEEHDLAFGSGDPSKIREWMIKRVNRWQVDSENKYMSGCMDKWKSLAVSREKFAELMKGKDVYYGLDLSKTTDLTADAQVFWLDDGRLAVSAHGFMPEERATQHEHSDRVPYKHWAQEGWCTLTEGAVTDYNYIKTHMSDTELTYNLNILEVCYDPYNASHFTQELESEGYKRVEIRQAFKHFLSLQKIERTGFAGKVVHDGSPLLTWCLSNAVEVSDNNGNIKLSKKHKDDSQRIDLAAAVINAMVRALVNEPETGGRVFFV